MFHPAQDYVPWIEVKAILTDEQAEQQLTITRLAFSPIIKKKKKTFYKTQKSKIVSLIKAIPKLKPRKSNPSYKVKGGNGQNR